jgi:hypothetical protein
MRNCFYKVFIDGSSVCHVKRTGNVAANKLAKLALSLGDERLWREDYSLCVRESVIDDIISV